MMTWSLVVRTTIVRDFLRVIELSHKEYYLTKFISLFPLLPDWALDKCLDESGGSSLASTGTGKWYVLFSFSFAS